VHISFLKGLRVKISSMMKLKDHIAEYADIDTRRAMGYPPRRLQIDKNQVLRPFKSFKFYPNENKLIRFYRMHWDHMELRIVENVAFDPDTYGFFPVPGYAMTVREYSLSHTIVYYDLPTWH
jgi:hypothetical protein